MGQFTEGEIIIEANSKESADKIAEKIQNLDEYLESKGSGGHTSVTDVDASDSTVYVKLCSDRFPNAEWQMQQILEMCKDLFKGEFNCFTADYTVPENLIYQEFDEEGEEI